MTAEEKLLENGYEGTVYLTNYSYDDALVGSAKTAGRSTTTTKWLNGSLLMRTCLRTRLQSGLIITQFARCLTWDQARR